MSSYDSELMNLENFKIECEQTQELERNIYAILDKETQSPYTAKILKKDIQKYPQYKVTEISNEINTLSKITHPSIIKYFGYSPTDFTGRTRPVIITEYVPNNTLVTFFKNKDFNSIDWESTKYMIIYGIASAMSYLHSHNIIHCNLTIDNIYLDEYFCPKISGFEFSRKTANCSQNKPFDRFCRMGKQSRYYAPEILSKKEYSKSSDVYSFGVLLYEIFNLGKQDEKGETFLQFARDVVIEKMRPTFKYKSSLIPSFYKELIEKCWSDDPFERPTFSEIIEILREEPTLINDEDYHGYIEFIDYAEISFDSKREFHQLDELINSQFRFEECEEKANKVIEKKNFIDWLSIDKNTFGYIDLITNIETGEKCTAQSFIEIINFGENVVLNFSQELAVISQLNHPSIVKFIGYTPISNDDLEPIIVNELLQGTLKYILDENDHIEFWDDTQKLIVIYGIAFAMSYLHAHNIIHRDLTPQNIQLDELFFPKIGGFHLSKELPPNSTKEITKSIQGTPAYLSPEIYLNKEYSKSSDVYSFSLIVYEIVTNKKPFEDFSIVNQIIEKVVNCREMPEIGEDVPLCYRSLIERCWSYEPNDRPTFDEIVELLRNDESFITDKINSEDYKNYIKYLDNSSITFNVNSKIKYSDITDLSLESFRRNDMTKLLPISVFGIFDTEPRNVSIDFDYLNINDYEKLSLIDSGGFSTVYQIVDKRTGINYAAKEFILSKKKYKMIELIDTIREVNLLAQIKHPSIVKFVGFSPISFDNKPNPVLVTELSLNRSLFDILSLLQKNEDISEWNDTKKLICIYGIASAMSYLHSCNIIHRDLKPSNILINDYLFPILVDFGLSTFLHDDKDLIDWKGNGTPSYIAPETMNQNIYSKPSDVYSFALTIYEIITGVQPFATLNNGYSVLFESSKKSRPEISSKIPKCYRDLIEKCWSQEPNERPTFSEIIDILRTDTDFITEDVDQEEYYNYIKYIDESEAGFEYHPNKEGKNQTEIEIDSFEKSDIFIYLDTDLKAKKVNVDTEQAKLYDYQKQKEIGRGSFGTVYKIANKKNGEIYAAKISQTYLTQCDDDTVKNLEREINIISSIEHPAILKFVGFNSINFNGKPKPTIITELLSNGSLEDIIELERRCCGNLDWDDTKKLINIYGIASAMSYLHSCNIVHRDLKPANILLDEYLFPKISDFGLSKNLSELNGKKSGFKGTYAYAAPEIFNGQYTKAGDVYAFAIIVYEIMTAEMPYDGISSFQLLAKVPKGFRPEFKTEIPNCYRELIESCWQTDLTKRPTFDEIVDKIKNDPDFITENVDIDEFLNYVDLIERLQKQNRFEFVVQHFDFVYKALTVKILNIKKYKLGNQIDDRNGFKKFKMTSRITNESFICKISKQETSKLSQRKEIQIVREVDIISQLNHPIFLKFIGYSLFNFDYIQSPVIVTENASNGTLRSVLDNQTNDEWNDTLKLINIFGIAFGMKCLHSKNIIHRYLTPSGIFVDSDYYPKISDFDFAKDISNNYDEEVDFLGNYFYTAPETFKGKYSKSSDVYSFGMIVYEIVTKTNPYKNLPQFKILAQALKWKRPQISDEVPLCYRHLIEECWSQDPSKRPSFDEIVTRLKTEKEFITEKVDENEFIKYVEYIEKDQENLNKPIIDHLFIIFQKQLAQCESNESEKEEKERNEEKEELKERDENQEEKVEEEEEKEESNLTNKSQEPEFRKVSVSYDDLQETTENEDQMKDEFLDLDHFKLGELICKRDYCKICKVINKETGIVYTGKISTIKMNKLTRDELINLSRETNIISQLHHPTFLKFIGYSPIDFKHKRRPVIVTELSKNGTLKDLLEILREKKEIRGWDSTTKLINIYGIASGMSYLHSNNIIHRDLNPMNVYLDDYLFPKIGDFGLSKRVHKFDTLTYQSTSGMKGNPIYSSPEILQFDNYTKSGDVYSFGFIVFEIMTDEIPFAGIVNKNEIFNEVVNKNNRPNISEKVPECYRQLIESCWSQNPSDRPSFDDIVEILKTDTRFITEDVKQENFNKYVEFIEKSKKSFDSTKRILNIDEFIANKNKIEEMQSKDSSDDENESQKVEEGSNDSIQKDIRNEKEVETELSSNEDTEFVDHKKFQTETIEGLISSNRPAELMHFLQSRYDNKTISSIFDCLSHESSDFYEAVLQEGLSLNNPVSHHKYAASLLFKNTETPSEIQIEEAKRHLELSASLGFPFSYFLLSRLHHELVRDDSSAFKYAQEGSNSGDSYSKCLLGHFIYNGIGTNSDPILGCKTMIESGAEDYIDHFAIEIGIDFYRMFSVEKDESKKEEFQLKSFEWFKKAFVMHKTTATINNYAVCFILGHGVPKDIEKAKEILKQGVESNDSNSKFILGLLLSESDPDQSSHYIKEASSEGHQRATLYLNDYKLDDDKKSKIIENFQSENLNAISYIENENESEQRKTFRGEILGLKNCNENTYLFMNKLIFSGEFKVPFEYGIDLYKQKRFSESFYYMNALSKFDHPIAKFFLGVMKYKGEGCTKNRDECFSIMKELSQKGIEKADEFIDYNF